MNTNDLAQFYKLSLKKSLKDASISLPNLLHAFFRLLFSKGVIGKHVNGKDCSVVEDFRGGAMAPIFLHLLPLLLIFYILFLCFHIL